MKKLLMAFLVLCLGMVSCYAEDLPALSDLTGLDPLHAEITSAAYSTGTKLERSFVITDAEELERLAQAVSEIEIVGVTEEYVTDMYPSLVFTLSDGTQHTLRFDGKWLEVGGKNYILAHDDAFWQLIDSLLNQYAAPIELPFQPNCTDIYLPANPTTGYGWQFSVDTPDVVSVTEQYFPDASEPGMAGVGGTHWFHFDGLFPGTAAVTLTYARPWEDTAQTTLVFRITVDEQLNVLIWGFEWPLPINA